MKKTALLLLMLLAVTGCKELAKRSTKAPSEAATVTGEFLYWNNAAVLKTENEIYGVVVDEKMQELDAQCKPFKKDDYDMVAVTVKGIVKKNPVPGSWEEIIEIKEVVSVSGSTNQKRKKYHH